MKKKVFVKDVGVDKAIERLHNGETIFDDRDDAVSLYIRSNTLIKETEFSVYVGTLLCLDKYHHYFVEEVEVPEPEADESCIRKFCKFWDENNPDDNNLSILFQITDGEYVSAEGKWYPHCRPLTKEEVLAYTKEK